MIHYSRLRGTSGGEIDAGQVGDRERVRWRRAAGHERQGEGGRYAQEGKKNPEAKRRTSTGSGAAEIGLGPH